MLEMCSSKGSLSATAQYLCQARRTVKSAKIQGVIASDREYAGGLVELTKTTRSRSKLLTR